MDQSVKEQNITREIESLSSSVMVELVMPQLKALDKTLKDNGYSEYDFSLLSERDHRMCLEFDNGQWILFFSELGGRNQAERFESFADAGNALIDALTESREEADSLEKDYQNNLIKSIAASEPSSKTFQRIQSGYRKVASMAAVL